MDSKSSILCRYKLRKLLIVLVLFFIVLTVYFYRRQNKALTIEITASAKLGGEYIKFLTACQKTLNNDAENYSIKMEIKNAVNASNSTIKQIEEGEINLGLVQSNIKNKGTNLASIAFAFIEPFYLFSNDKQIKSIGSLASHSDTLKLVYLGHETQTAKDLESLLTFYGIQNEKIKFIEANYDSSRILLQEKKVDLGFFIVGLGNPAIGSMMQDTALHLVNFENHDAFVYVHGNFIKYTVPEGLYGLNFPEKPYETFSTKAMIVCGKDMSVNDVFNFTKAIFEKESEIANAYPFIDLEQIEKFKMNSTPLHPGALLYYNKDEPSYLDKNSTLIGTLLSIFGLLISAIPLFKQIIKK